MKNHRLAFLWILFVPASLFAESLRILAVEEPPSSFLNPDDRVDGFSTEVVRYIQQRLQDNTEIVILPESRVLKIAQGEPNVVFFSFSTNPARETQFHKITLLLRKPWSFFTLADNDLRLNSIQEAKSLNGIGVVRGDVREEQLIRLGFANIKASNKPENNVKMLLRGRVEALYYESVGLAYVAANLDIPFSHFKEVLTTQSSEVYLFMSRNGTKTETVEKWREVASEMKHDGSFQKIAEKWSERIYQSQGIRATFSDSALNF
jgi:polar amino acid transport system substrate-binding protein